MVDRTSRPENGELLNMSGNWGLLLAELVPPAMVVAWSPVKIISALLLVLNSARPKPTALALLAGWLVGLGAVTALFVRLPRLVDSVHHSSVVGRTLVIFAIVVGVVLIVVAGYRWVRRDRGKTAPERLSRFSEITPLGAAILGLVLPVAGPKVLAMCATAGIAIGNASIGGAGGGMALVYYTALAASPIIVSVVGYWLAADTVNRWLVSLRLRLQHHQSTVTTIVIALIGLVLLSTGLRAM
jgi:uncharacterized membrane protein YidH (DUF202 family)